MSGIVTAPPRIVLGDMAAAPAPTEADHRKGGSRRRSGSLIACLAAAALVLANAAAQHVHVDDHEHAEDDCAICAMAVNDGDSSQRPALSAAFAQIATVPAQPAQSPRPRAPREQRQRGPPHSH